MQGFFALILIEFLVLLNALLQCSLIPNQVNDMVSRAGQAGRAVSSVVGEVIMRSGYYVCERASSPWPAAWLSRNASSAATASALVT
jgi:hypothetical protein